MELQQQCGHCNNRGAMKKCVCMQTFYCNKQCQVADWKNHKPKCPPFVRKLAGGNRWGLVATRNLNAGKVIVHEKAAILVQILSLVENRFTIETILQQFYALTSGDQNLMLAVGDRGDQFEPERNPVNNCDKEFLSKMYSKHGGREKVRKIVSTFWHQRCVTTDGGCYLYLFQIQLNHSCAGNTVGHDLERDNLGHVFSRVYNVTRDVAKGEELTTRYVFCKIINTALGELSAVETYRLEMAPRSERTGQMSFECLCEVCSLTGQALDENEKVRKEICELYDKFKLLQVEQSVKYKEFTNDAADSCGKKGVAYGKAGECFEVGNRILALLSQIPNELEMLRRDMLGPVFKMLADALRETKPCFIEPKEYKTEMLRSFKAMDPLKGENDAKRLIEEMHRREKDLYGGQHLELFSL